MDLMGLGDSDRPPREYSVADYAKNAIALWDHWSQLKEIRKKPIEL
nr:hypothetical protein [Pleurocapsa sp. CCALA 161]